VVVLLTCLRTELSPSWEAANCAAIQKIPSNFKEREGSSPCSQEPSTGPYPEPVQSSPYHLVLSPRSILILSTHLWWYSLNKYSIFLATPQKEVASCNIQRLEGPEAQYFIYSVSFIAGVVNCSGFDALRRGSEEEGHIFMKLRHQPFNQNGDMNIYCTLGRRLTTYATYDRPHLRPQKNNK
jgi:hypothetical protein